MKNFRRKFGVFATAVAALLGTVVATSPSGLVSAAASPVRPVNPVRLLDTRPGSSTVDGVGAGIGRRPAGSITPVQIAGRGGVPWNAAAAFINLTAVLPTGGTFLSAYPCDTRPGSMSSVNTPAGDIRANSVFVKLSGSGTVCIFTAAATDFIVDINGFVPSGGSPKTVSPTRLFDTRRGAPTPGGIGQRPAGSITPVQIAGRGGVPWSASAAIINLTAVIPTTGTYLSVFPCGTAPPNVSNLNSPAGDIRASSVLVKLSANGTVCVYTAGATDFVIDINGYVPSGGAPNTVYPARLFDTRPGASTVDGAGAGIGRRPAGSVTTVQIAGRGGVPANAAAAIINLTAVVPAQDTFLSVYPCDNVRPNVSNLNSPARDVRANSALVKLSTRGTVCVYTAGATDFIIDINGYVPAR